MSGGMATFDVERWQDESGRLFARHAPTGTEVSADTEDELAESTAAAIGRAHRGVTEIRISWKFVKR